MPTRGVVAGTPAENNSPALQLIGKRLCVLEDLTLQRGVEGLRQGVEGLRQGVISAAADRAHRLPDHQLRTRVLERMGSVDTAMVRVKNCVVETSVLALGHHQGVLDQGRTHVIGNREADQPAGETVDDRGQVHIRPVRDRQVRDIADVDLVRCRGGEPPADEIRKHRLPPIRDSRGDLAFLGVANQLQRAHDPGDFLVIDRTAGRVVVELRRDAFGAVAAAFCGEHGLDPCAEDRVAEQALCPGGGGVSPFVIRGPVEFQNLT